MTLPPRRNGKKSGITRAPARVFQVHRAFLRRHHCVVPGCMAEPIEVSHLRTAANSGAGLKPPDSSAVPMCGGAKPDSHHAEYHRIGHQSFQAKYKVDLFAIAAEFARRTTDKALRDSMVFNVPHLGRIS